MVAELDATVIGHKLKGIARQLRPMPQREHAGAVIVELGVGDASRIEAVERITLKSKLAL